MRYSFSTLAYKCGEWAEGVFTRATPASICEHLRREVVELTAKPTDVEEAADCAFLLFHLAFKQGWNLERAVIDKLNKNKNRKWGAPDADGVVEHVREPEPAPVSLDTALAACGHASVSFSNPRMKVCFDCGSTKRPDETSWLKPWLWRKG